MSIKISELPVGSALSGTEEIPIVQSATTKKITAQDVADLASGGDLQQVTDNGNTTTHDLIVTDGSGEGAIIGQTVIVTQNTNNDSGASINNDGSLRLQGNGITSQLKNTNVTNSDVILEFPDKATGSYTIATTADLTSGTVTSVDLTMPSAFTVTGNPVTTSGTLAVAGAGVATQYIRGDGQLANFPTSTGGGASVSYYLNGSVSQGTFGGVAMKEINKTPIIGAGTDFTINADGYIQSFITDANDPNQLEIPSGNWNFETYFSASSSGGSPSFYVELYKWDGATLTLISSNSANPEGITNGTAIDLYLTALAVPQTTLALTDRLVVRIYVTHSGRTIKLHTEDNHLSQIITTFSTGLTALNGLTAQVQNLAVGTSGTDFAISSATSTHTFNLPTASATNRGALSSADWTTFNGKVASNTAITGATKTKITYDAKGLVTAGADATTADIADSLNKRYVTDANLTVIGNTSGTNTGDQTFFNPRVQTVSSSATVTATSTNDIVTITGQLVGLTLANPTGTFSEGQSLIFRIKDSGTARSIAYGTNFRAIGVTAPTTTVANKTTYIGCIYNSTDTKFDIVGTCTEA
jgi:hypothetical protein